MQQDDAVLGVQIPLHARQRLRGLAGGGADACHDAHTLGLDEYPALFTYLAPDGRAKGVVGKRGRTPMVSMKDIAQRCGVSVATVSKALNGQQDIHAYDFKLKKAAWGFILAVMMVPTQVFAIDYYKFMIQLKLIDTYWPLIIPAITTPVVVFIMYFLLSRYIVEGVSLGSVKG